MVRTLVNLNPSQEARSMEEIFDHLFGTPVRPTTSPVSTLPIDIVEHEGSLKIRAAVPGVEPKDLEIQVEKNVLTIRGEIKQFNESNDVKVYRREVSYGAFARSVRLPDNLDIDNVDAEFKNGLVTISLPRIPEEKPKSIKITVRTSEESTSTEN